MDPAAQLSQLLLAAGIPISGVSQPSAGVLVIQFSGNETEAEVSQANSILESFTPSPVPNLSAFKSNVLQDVTIPPASLAALSRYSYDLQDLVYTPTALQALWSVIKSTDANLLTSVVCTDNTPVPTKIESYASTYGVPLT